MENEEIEELDFCEWWEMLDDIEQSEYNRCMKELEDVPDNLEKKCEVNNEE